MKSLEKLKEQRLPAKKQFYSSLSGSNINDDDYKHAKRVFKKFKCENIEDYKNIYVKSDVLLLANIFTSHRLRSYETYGIDPACSISAPGLSPRSTLKYTGFRKDLITDINMHQMIENGTRGVIGRVTVQYAKANNEYTTKNFNKNTNEATVINDYDANNFYGYAMLERLPLQSYSWVNDRSTNAKNFVVNHKDDDYGYILEVPVEYPKKLHDIHFDLPFLCVPDTVFKTKKLLCTLKINKDMLYT